MSQKYLFMFDLDGTLISGYMDREDKNYHAWEVLPGRVEALADVRDKGHHIGIVTNQAGVGLGFASYEDWLVKWCQVVEKLFPMGASFPHGLFLGSSQMVRVCFAHPKSKQIAYNNEYELRRRKPSPSMLYELLAATACPLQLAHFIGDRPEDKQAADAAGVSFSWADAFFANYTPLPQAA